MPVSAIAFFGLKVTQLQVKCSLLECLRNFIILCCCYAGLSNFLPHLLEILKAQKLVKTSVDSFYVRKINSPLPSPQCRHWLWMVPEIKLKCPLWNLSGTFLHFTALMQESLLPYEKFLPLKVNFWNRNNTVSTCDFTFKAFFVWKFLPRF